MAWESIDRSNLNCHESRHNLLHGCRSLSLSPLISIHAHKIFLRSAHLLFWLHVCYMSIPLVIQLPYLLTSIPVSVYVCLSVHAHRRPHLSQFRYFKNLKYSGTSVYVLNPFQILGLIPDRTYTKRIFPIRNKGKMINPFPWKKFYCYWHIIHWWGCIK
jgi:hypothetical protein